MKKVLLFLGMTLLASFIASVVTLAFCAQRARECL